MCGIGWLQMGLVTTNISTNISVDDCMFDNSIKMIKSMMKDDKILLKMECFFLKLVLFSCFLIQFNALNHVYIESILIKERYKDCSNYVNPVQ